MFFYDLTAVKRYSQYLKACQTNFHETEHMYPQYCANHITSFLMAQEINVSILFGPPLLDTFVNIFQMNSNVNPNIVSNRSFIASKVTRRLNTDDKCKLDYDIQMSEATKALRCMKKRKNSRIELFSS